MSIATAPTIFLQKKWVLLTLEKIAFLLYLSLLSLKAPNIPSPYLRRQQ